MVQAGVMKNRFFYIFIVGSFFFSCGETEKKNKISNNVNVTPPIKTEKIIVERPNFNGDSAYQFIKDQVDFGPRFPNNEAHGKTANYLKNKLKSYGLETQIQKGNATTFNNKNITIKNIIGEYNPDAKKRILLFAHWDSRPFADQDTKNMTKPILGANDGASGVGVLLEVARQLSIIKPEIGVDIIFFDAEDYGEPSSGMVQTDTESWCLGSQYWSKNMHKENYTADYGILLDMVGSANAYFTHERISMTYAPNLARKVWKIGQQLGYQNMFIDKETNFVGTDDHKYVNEIANIPSIDIIHYEQNRGSFHPSWHTHGDNMSVIDKYTITAVGETLLAFIQSEK
jgi:Zn-dependent M28 family amino/carboxypeptidase